MNTPPLENGTSWVEGTVTRTVLSFDADKQRYLVHTEKRGDPVPALWLSREGVERRLGDALAKGLGLTTMDPAKKTRYLRTNMNDNPDDEKA